MTFEQAFEEFRTLPDNVKQEVVDYISFLKTKYTTVKSAKPRKKIDLTDDPFVGIWRNRNDLSDSNAWVRKTRKNEWDTNG